MTHRFALIFAAAALGLSGSAIAQAPVPASSSQLRASLQAGEQWNGYLGIVGAATPDLQSRVNAVNIRRRAAYTRLALQRRVQIEEVGATMACEIFATAILPGQYYRLPDGAWRRREGNAPVQRPAYCI